ncbi:hypothetical protein FRC03_009284 [Tulasnella sp. 419]|nr:hypothetical protein FRC03_009284 [Tulasnella sp. 419]
MSRTLLLLVLIQLGTLLSSSQAHEDGRRSRRSKHKRLDSLSTLSTDDGLQRVGCFADENLNALGDYSSASVTNSPSSCATACELRGLPYAGLRAGIQCLCGTSESLVKVSDSDCAIPCPGNRSQTCGGTGRRELFKLVPKDSGGEPKLVIAHFMVGNTYPYGFQDWITDIRAASDNSIDGFALNVGRDSWNGDRVRDAYAAAQAIGPMFKLLLSFDVTAMSCGSYDDANFIRQYIANYANHPNQLKDSRGRIIVSTFGGEYCTFGQGNLNDGWRKAVKEGLPETLFIPSFFSDPSNFKDYNVVDGMFYHYGPDTFNKNWIFKGDNHLYNTRWDLLIAHRNEIGIAEIISWNDYGESHYIGR